MKNPLPTAKNIQLILAVTGASPRSNRARANLTSFLEQHSYPEITPEEIDLLNRPEIILELGVFASPALVHRTGSGEVHILYGDMTDTRALEDFLGGCLASP